jgi:hypothetical protein
MLKYAQIVDETTGAVNVGLGDDVEFYESIGMSLMDVEQAADGGWYLAGKVPAPSAEYQARQLYAALKQEQEMRAVSTSIPLEDEATAFTLSPVCPAWKANHHYQQGEIVNHEGLPYRVVQDVDSLEHQAPGTEGMLAIYRPIDPAPGTLEEPKRFYFGMDVTKDLYYTHNGKVYLAKSDMPACVYEPGSEGLWQWEEVETL